MDSLTDFFHTLDGLYADGRHGEIEDFLRRTLAHGSLTLAAYPIE